MNIIIISSSPRKEGNSDLLCNEFMKGALTAGHQVEKVFLREKKINYCTGCGVCYTQKKCSQKDDMAMLLDKLIQADVIVFSSPIYFYTMCGQLKTLIDRCCARYTEMTNKSFYYILAAAENNIHAMDKTLIEFEGFFDCLDKPTLKGGIKAIGVWEKGDVLATQYMQEAYELGAKV